MIGLIAAFLIGGFCGVVIMALMKVASDSDDKLLGDDQYE
jgi:hypothetical protein